MNAATKESVVKRVLIDLDRCIECRSCAAACFYSHADMPAIQFARSGVAMLPIICRQCLSAPCVDVCPAEAMIRDEQGIVRRRLFRCIGCGSCARACPFGVLPNEPTGVPAGYKSTDRLSGHQIAKCDLCADRLVAGDGVPRCVSACPSGALRFDDEHDAEKLGLIILSGRTTGRDPYKRR